MSLIYWWPFTDNTVDKINGKTFTSTNWSFQSNGKIGNCFAPSWTDSNTISRQIYADNVSIPETFSVAVWVKNNNNFNSPRTYCPIQFSNGDCWLTGTNNKGWDFSHNSLRLIFNNGSNVSGNAGNAEVNWGYNPREFLGNWYHIAFTVNKTTRKAELFINGVSKGVKDLPSAVDTYGGTFKLKINWVQGWMLDGSLNDLRIYDHTLSQAEVKELSKALVMHYSFDDILAEPTTNLVTAEQLTISSLGMSITYSRTGEIHKVISAGTAGVANTVRLNIPKDVLTSGQSYYASYKYRTITGTGNFVPSDWCDNTTAGRLKTVVDCGDFYYVTCPCPARTYDGTYRFLDLYIDGQSTIEMWDFQLQTNSFPTPYCKGSRNSQLYNETGLVQPSTKNNIVISTDSGAGIYSLSCKGSTTIATSNTCDISQGTTASVWIKGAIPTDSRLVFADSNSKTAFGFFNNGQAIITCAGYGYAHVSDIKTGWTTDWNHIVVTRDSSGNISCYLNNNKLTLSGSQEWTHNIESTLSIGCRYNGGWTSYFTGLVDDFRFYATCLSTNDITELYKTKAYITDKGDVMCGEFVEDKTEAKVTEKSIFECNETQEKLAIQGFELLDGILIEKNPYFNTGLVFSDVNTSIYVDAEVTPTNTSGNNCLAGGGNSDWNGPIMLNFCGGKMEFGTSGYSTSTEPQGKFAANERLTVQAEIYPTTQKWYKNNVQINNITQRARKTTNATFAIGTFKTSSGTVGATHSFKGYIHRFYVKYGDEIRCYLPAKRKSDNVYGLYDIHTKTFLVNSGGGTVSGTASTLCDEAAIYQDGYISGREIIEL